MRASRSCPLVGGWWRMLCLLACMLPLLAQGHEQALNLAHMFAPGSIPDQAAEHFAALVAARTKRVLRIVVHRAGALGDERDNLAQLRRGQLDFALTGNVVVSNFADKYRIVNMPFVYSSPEHALRVFDSELGQAIRGNLRSEGVELLSWHYVGTRMLTANVPIRDLRDVHGLALRLPPDSTALATWQALGANPRQIPFTELENALRLGRVAAQENPPHLIRTSHIYAYQKYLIATNHLPQPQLILGAGELLKRLHPEHRQIVLQAAREASAWATEQAKEEQQRDILWLTDEGGMTLIDFNPRGIERALSGLPRRLAGDDGETIFRQLRALR